jgi:hypothetical protein
MSRLGLPVLVALAGLAAAAHGQPLDERPSTPPEAAAPSEAPAAPPPLRCAPVQLTHIVTRNISPGLQASDRRAQPRELWRQGAFFLRSLETVDPTTGARPLVIVSEPDVWMIDLASRTGQHRTDPGPELEVRAPVLPPAGTPPVMLALEFGCEAEWVAAYAPREERVVPWGGARAALHSLVQGEHAVAILMDQRRNTPLMVSYLRGGRPVQVIRYDDYRNDLGDRPQMFELPPNLKITEAGPIQPPPE